MLEKPSLLDDSLLAVLQQNFNPKITGVEFLPLGADNNTAVYRACQADGKLYFVRVRSGGFDPISAELLHFLSEQGMKTLIAPLATRIGLLWADLDSFKVMLYPYVDGQNVYEIGLRDQHWIEFGEDLRRLHAFGSNGIHLPHEMAMRIRTETYDPLYHQWLRASLAGAERESPDDPLGSQCTALLRERTAEIQALLERTERLLEIILARELEFVLCHADLHAGNLLVDTSGKLHIIDWDEILLAPKERDLMYIGGGLLGRWRSPAEEEALFYQGYGPVAIDPVALAYYRYERIITDLAIYGEELLSEQGSRDDRELSFHYMSSNFDPGGVLEIARGLDRT